MLELIVPVSERTEARNWKFDNIRFSVPVGAGKDTFQEYGVRAVHEWNNPAFSNTSILNVVSSYPIKWCFTSELEDYNDTSLMVKKFNSLSGLFYSVVYNVRNFDCLKAIEPGSGVAVQDIDPSELCRLKDYKVWISPCGGYRKQWMKFCEYVTRGIIPAGVMLDPGSSVFTKGIVIRRDLGRETTKRPIEWITATSVQNIVSYWEVIQSQMDRISRARIPGDLRNYGLSGVSSVPTAEETV